LARFLYLYVNADPIKGLDPLRGEFVKLIFSKQGQEVVLKDGYYPVSADVARQDLKACKLDPKF
jgi:phosphate transport system substrate-binding protein